MMQLLATNPLCEHVSSRLRKYEFIDALRGYAILGVLMVHSAQSVRPNHAFLRSAMAQGSLGVQLFYIASALTLCLSWRFRSTQEGHPTRDFYIRRFFRIAPMFYLAIVLYVLLNGLAPQYWAPNGIKWWFVGADRFFHALRVSNIWCRVFCSRISLVSSRYLRLAFLRALFLRMEPR